MPNIPTPPPRQPPIRSTRPPVTLTVWPPGPDRAGTRQQPTGGELGAAVAARLIATYTRPGDLVVALHSPATIPVAARWLDRRALTILTVRDRGAFATRVRPRLWLPARPGSLRVVATGAQQVPALLRTVAGRATLIITSGPGPDTTGDNGQWRQWLAAVPMALAPGGMLVVRVAGATPGGGFADHATDAITAARAAGLTYHQHLITIDAPLSELPVTPTGRPTLPSVALDASAGRHRRVHTDLFAFLAPGAVDA